MNRVVIIGEVINDIKLKKSKNGVHFASLVIKDDYEIFSLLAIENIAMEMFEKIKKGMIVGVECKLGKYKKSKYNNVFRLYVKTIEVMYINKETIINSKKVEVGLNGKPLPF